MSEEDQRAQLKELAESHAWDVAGNFDPRVYKFARACHGAAPGGASFAALDDSAPVALTSLEALDDRILVEGPTGTLRKLADKGTLVFVPTHLSNLDSVVFGFALERAGLPPATYGAGKNLFTNPVLSFFMHNLGAYRVDRRLKHAPLQGRAQGVLVRPHRARLPLALLSRRDAVAIGRGGAEAEARARGHRASRRSRGRPSKGSAQHVFFVPATINYLLTLEAETLIDDFLQEEGKARYIIEDDESTASGIAAFMQKLLGLDAQLRRFASRSPSIASATRGRRGGTLARPPRAHGRARRVRPRGRRTGRSATARATPSTRASSGRSSGRVQEGHRRDVDPPRRGRGVRAPARHRGEGGPLRDAAPRGRRRVSRADLARTSTSSRARAARGERRARPRTDA